jgi:hypothetical protein
MMWAIAVMHKWPQRQGRRDTSPIGIAGPGRLSGRSRRTA